MTFITGCTWYWAKKCQLKMCECINCRVQCKAMYCYHNVVWLQKLPMQKGLIVASP